MSSGERLVASRISDRRWHGLSRNQCNSARHLRLLIEAKSRTFELRGRYDLALGWFRATPTWVRTPPLSFCAWEPAMAKPATVEYELVSSADTHST